MSSTNFVSCLTKLIDNNFNHPAIKSTYKKNIDSNNPQIILEALYQTDALIFHSLGNIQQCLPIPNEITAFTGANKRASTPKSITSEKYKTVFDITQYTTKFFGSGASTLSDNLKKDLCKLLNNQNFCPEHSDWSAAGILLCMIDAREGTAFADVPSGSCAYNTACYASDFSNLIKDPDGSNSLATQVRIELCELS